MGPFHARAESKNTLQSYRGYLMGTVDCFLTKNAMRDYQAHQALLEKIFWQMAKHSIR